MTKMEDEGVSLVMRPVVVALSAVFACLLVLAPAQSAPPATGGSHISQGWSKTICCKKDVKAFWSTERQCRLAQGAEAKAKVCHDSDAKTKACCKKEARTWWSNRRDCRRTGLVVHDTLCKPKA
jgi:hypothetical protein